MKSEEFIVKIKNFDGSYEELGKLIDNYLYSDDENIEYKLQFYHANEDIIQSVMRLKFAERNEKLPFNYQNLYDFQYQSLLYFYFEQPSLLISNKDENLVYNLYKLHCEIFKLKEEFAAKDFKSYELASPYCKFLIIEFINDSTKIQPLCHKIFYPFNISNRGIELYLPFTVEYNYDDKQWLCVHEYVDKTLKRVNLSLDVSKMTDEEIIDEILFTLNLYPMGGTA